MEQNFDFSANHVVNVINLPRRTDRRALVEKEAAEQGFKIAFWEGVYDAILPCRGISKAHKQIVRFAKEAGLPHITIAEDDIKFFAPGAFDYFLKNEPSDYDLYLGNVFDGDISTDQTIINFSGLTIYRIKNQFFDKFLSASEINNIDREMKNLGGRYVVCDPMICTQQGGFSDNSRKNVANYDRYFQGRKIFGLK